MATKTADAAKEDTDAKGGGKKKLMIIVLVVVLALAGGAFFFLKSKGGKAEPKPPEPGPVVVLDPITINLAGSHFLKLGIALQPLAGAKHEADGSHALDLAIEVFTGLSIDELSKAEGRHKAKEKLLEEVKHAYHEEVYDIYFTEFVMQ